MKTNKTICVALAVLLLLAAHDLAAAGKNKTSITLLGGLNMFGAIGSDSDYVAGENDFPAIPSYQAPVMGLRLSFGASRRMAWGLDIRYGLTGTVDRRDPSDNETVSVDTPQNLTAILQVQTSLDLTDQLALLIVVGGGAEYRLAQEKTFISSLGNKIVVGKPDKPLSPLVAAGLGLQYMFSDSFGLVAEGRVAYAVRTPAQMVITPALGLVIRF
jgi:hypothetical protein